MQLAEILARLSAHKDELTNLGVKSLAVFGSAARNEARPDSDVDILVELSRPMGLFGLADIQFRLEEILGVQVDLVTRSGVHPALRERIFGEAIHAI